MAQLTHGLTPVVTAHGKNTNGTANDFAVLLFIQTTSGTLPAAVVGVPYNGTGYQFQSVGGSGTITWTATGTLPTGLTLSPSGLLSGTPSGAGTFTFTVTASDGEPDAPDLHPDHLDDGRGTDHLDVRRASARTRPSSVRPVPVTVTVTDTQSGGTASSPTGTVTLSGDPGLSATNCVLASSAPGASTCSVTVTPSVSGSARDLRKLPRDQTFTSASSGSSVLTVNQARPRPTSVSQRRTRHVFGQSVTFTATRLGRRARRRHRRPAR